jgi:hypothetical protein
VTGTYGETLYATVNSINNAGISGTASSVSGSGTILLDPNGDQNSAGLTNSQQDAAGFNPLDHTHYFHITSIVPVSGGMTLTWASVPGRTYQVLYASNPASGFTVLSGTITASGSSSSYTDTTVGGSQRFYRVNTPLQ